MRRWIILLALSLVSTASAQDAVFSPFEDCEAKAMAALDGCQKTLDVAQYNIRSPRFVEKLDELRRRGVKVRIVVDAKQAEKEYNTLDDEIERRGFELVRYRNTRSDYAIMHLKFAVIDSSTVLTGSYNWNETAQEVNDENMLVVHDPALAQAYGEEFAELLGAPEVSKPGKGEKVTVYFSPEDNARSAVLEQIKKATETIHVCMFTFKDLQIARALRARRTPTRSSPRAARTRRSSSGRTPPRPSRPCTTSSPSSTRRS
jgi:phosphatidylserine/phosphatidylglycerophosphate/cardiolipin synthase-like enzyme